MTKKDQSLPPLRKRIARAFMLETVFFGVVVAILTAVTMHALSVSIIAGIWAFFLTVLFFNFLLVDELTHRLSQPLKNLAEVLRSEPSPERPLALPEPDTLELRILTRELARLWDRLGSFRKLNIEQIVAQSRKLEAVLESVEDAILVLDHAGVVLQCNPGIAQLIGLSVDAIENHAWTDLSTTSDHYLKLRECLTDTWDEKKPIELVVGGGRRLFSVRRREITGVSGLLGVLYLLHDITELRQREKLREEFISVLSHELKTPLQSLGTASELLVARRARFDEESQLLIDTIAEDVNRIRSVAHEFIQVGRFQLHTLQIQMEKVVLADMLPQWLNPFRVIAAERNIEIGFENHCVQPPWSPLDPVKFPWVVSNLLSNAVRVSPDGARIVVTLEDEGGLLVLSVSDQGPGVSEAVRDRIFDPYFQDIHANTPNIVGFLGLGLSIAKEIVEAHDGTIDYHDNWPAGSIFKIRLPAFYL